MLKSMGPAGMHSSRRSWLCEASLHNFQKVMALGRSSSGLEKGSVTPILEKGKKEDAGNCRLLNLTPAPVKVMEQIVLENIPNT